MKGAYRSIHTNPRDSNWQNDCTALPILRPIEILGSLTMMPHRDEAWSFRRWLTRLTGGVRWRTVGTIRPCRPSFVHTEWSSSRLQYVFLLALFARLPEGLRGPNECHYPFLVSQENRRPVGERSARNLENQSHQQWHTLRESHLQCDDYQCHRDRSIECWP